MSLLHLHMFGYISMECIVGKHHHQLHIGPVQLDRSVFLHPLCSRLRFQVWEVGILYDSVMSDPSKIEDVCISQEDRRLCGTNCQFHIKHGDEM